LFLAFYLIIYSYLSFLLVCNKSLNYHLKYWLAIHHFFFLLNISCSMKWKLGKLKKKINFAAK